MIKYAISAVIFVLNLSFVCAGDWPDWRGPHRDGTWRETGVTDKFKSDKIEHKWTVPIGAGYSGPTVSGGKVYVTDKHSEPEETEGILCFDEQTGEKIWEVRYNCEYQGVGYPAGPRASVIINDGKAYSLGTMGHFYCLDAATGEILWRRDLNSDYEIRMPIWGIAAAPLIAGEKIMLQIAGSDGSGVVALDKFNGKEIWRSLADGASYSAPVLIRKDETEIIVVWTENHLAGLQPETGKVYWKIPWKLRMAMGIATPVLYKDYIFVSSFYNGSMLVKLGEDYKTARKIWQRSGESERKTDALHCVMNTPVILDGYIYGVDSYGELRCLELETGDRIWEDQTAVKRERWANIHFIQNGDITWMFNEQGELLITRLSPEGLHEMSRTKLIQPTFEQLPRGVVWSHPAFAKKHVFVRNDKELVSADLSE